MPTADRFMLHVYAAMAEEEGRRISQRTKAALAAAKARGVVLGVNGKVLAAQNKQTAHMFARTMAPIIDDLKGGGYVTVRETTVELNRRGVPSREGGRWHIGSTGLLLKRLTTN